MDHRDIRLHNDLARIVEVHKRITEEKNREVPIYIHPSIGVIAEACGVPARDLVKPGRETKYNAMRRALSWHLCVRRGLSLCEIGRRLHRDHGTIYCRIKHVDSDPDRYCVWLEMMERAVLPLLPLLAADEVQMEG